MSTVAVAAEEATEVAAETAEAVKPIVETVEQETYSICNELSSITWQDIWDSFGTLEFYVGAACILLIWVLFLFIKLIRRSRRDAKMILLKDNQGGIFKISFGAIQTYVETAAKIHFPAVTVRKIKLSKCHKKSFLKIFTETNVQTDLRGLREAFAATIRTALNASLGLDDDTIQRIDVVITRIRVDDDYVREQTRMAAAKGPAVDSTSAEPLPPVEDGETTLD